VLSETFELTLCHVGLGSLSEPALLTLFADAQAHCLTAGTDGTLREVVDAAGHLLYPAYYRTHLKVPPERLLDSFRLWDRVSVGVDLKSFGGMQLDGTYVLGHAGEVAPDPVAWGSARLPAMRGSTLFVVDHRDREQQVSIPAAGRIATLEKLARPPAEMDLFRRARALGARFFQPLDDPGPAALLAQRAPIRYPILPGRDVAAGREAAYAGHTLLFARFAEVMDEAERILLAEQVWPPFPRDLLRCRTVLERETYYFGTCGADQAIEAGVRAWLSPCPPRLHGNGAEIVSAATLRSVVELYDEASRRLLAVARAEKLLAVPSTDQGLLRDVERLLAEPAAEPSPTPWTRP
jgi:probable biosynthetic protein (TIGR04098 family)